jgi:hypothetical protein
MFTLLVLLVVLLVGCLGVYLLLERKPVAEKVGFALPSSLVGASLVLCEPKEVWAVTKPFPLHGRPDEVYLRNGVLVPLDTKTRARDVVYPVDVVKLSGYAAILRHHPAFEGTPVSSTGWIRVVNRSTGRVRHHQVELLTDNELLAIHRRRSDLLSKKATPRPATNPTYCRGCAQRSRCPSPRA